MTMDASAFVGLLFREPRWEQRIESIDGAASLAMGAPTLREASIVLQRQSLASHRVEGIVAATGMESVPYTWDHARIAHVAYLRYGKGRHPAALSYGDGLSYAVAKAFGQPMPLLRDDRSKTDVVPALAASSSSWLDAASLPTRRSTDMAPFTREDPRCKPRSCRMRIRRTAVGFLRDAGRSTP